jgi:ribosomal peptide maturation radical SAM protein 1
MPGTPLPMPTASAAAGRPHMDDATRAQRSAWPVVLISMPFMDATRPSIQLGLLKAIIAGHEFPVRTLHANLDFAALVGADYYRRLAEHRGRQVGDWLFSRAAFGEAAPDPDALFVDEFVDDLSHLAESPDELGDRLRAIRHRDVPAYLDSLVEALPWHDVRVVGFTSTFQQNTASFALARRLKQRYPQIVTVFGGANFDADMGLELVRSVHCIDMAVIGEGDTALPALLTALAAGQDPGDVPGVARRAGEEVVATPPAAPLRRLDDLPVPDYGEFFERAERLGLLHDVGHRSVWIPFESARGCWWGAKHHCTFCGLNGATMQFRSKSPARVLDELAQLARRYRSFMFEAVDNILDLEYLTRMFPVLIASAADYEMFYEVKANLNREQLKLMAASGVTRIQPGLESLSTNVLRLMRKGVRAAQNVNLLRWARYYGIDVAWNVLWGFPGETTDDYTAQSAVVPHLVHLQPPSGAGRIWMERFSPLHADLDAFPREFCRPERSYRYVYPDSVDLDRVAYFFEYGLKDALPDSVYAELSAAVDEWSRAWRDDKPPELTYWSAPGFLQIYDGRHDGRHGTYSFEGSIADIYLACGDRPTTAAAVRSRLGGAVPTGTIEEVFHEFQQRGLMFVDGTLALALALPAITGR